MATINLTRTSAYPDMLNDYELFLDGEKVGTIANGETKNIKTTSGQHTILAKVHWCSSPEFSFVLSETDKTKLTVGGFKNGNRILLIAFWTIVLHFILQILFNFDYTKYLIIPACVLWFYYSTFGRKKYLAFKELELK